MKKIRIPTAKIGTLVLFPFFMLAECKGRTIFLICKLFVRKFHWVVSFSTSFNVWSDNFCTKMTLLLPLSHQFVLAADEHLNGTLHFERKEEAGELSDGYVCLYCKDVCLLAVVL